MSHAWRHLATAAFALLLAGCATPAQHRQAFWADRSPSAADLTEVPFFAQRRYQCGPAALAMMLGASGAQVTPDELVPEVYLPARRGSLQTELVAAARRRGFLAYTVREEPAALLDEIAAGRPVLVLQNLGLRFWPRWHYAVVVGYDVEGDRLLLRSGTRRRVKLPRPRFEGTWDRASRWGLVLVRPGDAPIGAEPIGYARAVVDLASSPGAHGTEAAFRAGLERWPGQPLLLFGLANERVRAGDERGAIELLQRLLAAAPSDVAARNNLAMLLMRQGRYADARREIDQALRQATGTTLEAAVRASREEIDAAAAAANPRQ